MPASHPSFRTSYLGRGCRAVVTTDAPPAFHTGSPGPSPAQPLPSPSEHPRAGVTPPAPFPTPGETGSLDSWRLGEPKAWVLIPTLSLCPTCQTLPQRQCGCLLPSHRVQPGCPGSPGRNDRKRHSLIRYSPSSESVMSSHSSP